MDFEEFCAAALSVHQLEALDHCEQHARCVCEIFERDGNRAIVIEELASVAGKLHGICPILTFDAIRKAAKTAHSFESIAKYLV
ncbi:unnamed protein product [Prunus armeniaca]|uniref:Uncharacterized protein n=1 Tax=Prunus armeniaca TaxID=36596 RepID=A0A6J5Y3J7_PRUAR|nr:unnamed protein product [Prunus armeniaca]